MPTKKTPTKQKKVKAWAILIDGDFAYDDEIGKLLIYRTKKNAQMQKSGGGWAESEEIVSVEVKLTPLP